MTMTTTKTITVFSLAAVLAVASVFTVISTQNPIEAQEDTEERDAQGRTLNAFMFMVPEEYIDGVKYSGSKGGSAITELEKSESKIAPIIIRSLSQEPVDIDFHTTFGSDHRGEVKSIPGTTVTVEPESIRLIPGEDQVLNIHIITDDTVQDGTYRQSITGYWDDINGFLSTSINIQIGEGSEKVLKPRDVLK